MRLMARFWPSFRKDDNPEMTASAWAAMLYDVTLDEAREAAVRLARSDQKFFPAPEPRHVLDEARKQARRDTWEEKLARDAYECLGWEMPLYKKNRLNAAEKKKLR